MNTLCRALAQVESILGIAGCPLGVCTSYEAEPYSRVLHSLSVEASPARVMERRGPVYCATFLTRFTWRGETTGALRIGHLVRIHV